MKKIWKQKYENARSGNSDEEKERSDSFNLESLSVDPKSDSSESPDESWSKERMLAELKKRKRSNKDFRADGATMERIATFELHFLTKQLHFYRKKTILRLFRSQKRHFKKKSL